MAYAQRAEAAGSGTLMLQLGKHELVLNLTDSDGDSILDSNNDIIETVTYFIDMEDVESLVDRIDALEVMLKNYVRMQSEINNSMDELTKRIDANAEDIASNKADIDKLKSNALLDSNY